MISRDEEKLCQGVWESSGRLRARCEDWITQKKVKARCRENVRLGLLD